MLLGESLVTPIAAILVNKFVSFAVPEDVYTGDSIPLWDSLGFLVWQLGDRWVQVLLTWETYDLWQGWHENNPATTHTLAAVYLSDDVLDKQNVIWTVAFRVIWER